MKLNVLLAKTDSLAGPFKRMVNDFSAFFHSKQGAFKGERKTYDPKDGTVDEPNRRGNLLIQTTVDEKLVWFNENSKEYIDALFSQEKTNSAGIAKAELIVEGKSWGEFTSLELLRLKSIVDDPKLATMLMNLPTRSDATVWNETKQEMYIGRHIFEGPELKGTNKTTETEDFILKDPNVDKTSPNYTPVLSKKTTTVTLGEYSIQQFSGEWTQRQKALALKRRSKLVTAVIEALKTCNDVESVPSELNSDKIFGHLFGAE